MSYVWAEGDAYEAYVGRWSREVAAVFLDWVDAPAGARWIDVGCGTGALASSILDRCDPASVLGVDQSKHFVDFSAARVDDPRARFDVATADSLPAGVADVVVSGLVLNFVADGAAALASMRRAAPNGIVAAYVWDYSGRMELMRIFWDVAVELDPAAAELDEGPKFPLCHADALASLWTSSGLTDVEVRGIEVPTDFADFDAYWAPFLGGQGPAPGYVMSLDDDRRAQLREQLRTRLPFADDGSLHLVARAWAAKGTDAAG